MPEDAFQIRKATVSNRPRLLEIAQCVQDKLIQIGSVQQIAGYSPQNISERVDRGELYVLTLSGSLIGSAFIEPVTRERFPQIREWQAVPEGYSAWFLYGLVIDPAKQGQGWGHVLLSGICRQARSMSPAVLLLDCWAGNHKLRRFYSEAGFELHGEFPEDDYQIAVFRRNFYPG